MSLSALLERVKGATGPDRYIDFWATVLLWEPDPTDNMEAIAADIELVGIEEMWVAMPFSASVDAALALIGRVLPGCSWKLEARWARIYTAGSAYSGSAPTPALALCAALLAAMIGEEAKP